MQNKTHETLWFASTFGINYSILIEMIICITDYTVIGALIIHISKCKTNIFFYLFRYMSCLGRLWGTQLLSYLPGCFGGYLFRWWTESSYYSHALCLVTRVVLASPVQALVQWSSRKSSVRHQCSMWEQ
jgi:hypothetical protein